MSDTVETGTARRIALIRLSALGDVVDCLAAAHAVRERYPDAYISWIADERWARLIELCPVLDKVHSFPRGGGPRWIARWKRFMTGVKDERFDTVVDMQGNFRSGLVAWRSGAVRRIGYTRTHSREWNQVFMTEKVSPAPEDLHRRQQAMALLRPLGIDSFDGDVVLNPDSVSVEAVESFLGRFPGRKVLFHPGMSIKGDFKRWPENRYVELGSRLVADGVGLIISAGPGEEDLADRIRHGVESSVEGASVGITPPSWTLAGMIALIRRVDALVSADTGPLHFADALGVPCVAMFGPKDPSKYGPHRTRARVIHLGLPCSPCRDARCDHRECMRAIGAERVMESLDEILALGADRSA